MVKAPRQPAILPSEARAVAYFLAKTGKSQDEVARKIGIARPMFNQSLRGKRTFRPNEIELICSVLGVSGVDFVIAVEAARTSEGPLYFPELQIRVAAGKPLEGQEAVMARPEMWVEVEGESMSPRFESGDKVRVVRVFPDTELKDGDAVCVSFNSQEKLAGDALYEFYGSGGQIRLLKRNPAKAYRKDERNPCDPESIAAAYKVMGHKRAGVQ